MEDQPSLAPLTRHGLPRLRSDDDPDARIRTREGGSYGGRLFNCCCAHWSQSVVCVADTLTVGGFGGSIYTRDPYLIAGTVVVFVFRACLSQGYLSHLASWARIGKHVQKVEEIAGEVSEDVDKLRRAAQMVGIEIDGVQQLVEREHDQRSAFEAQLEAKFKELAAQGKAYGLFLGAIENLIHQEKQVRQLNQETEQLHNKLRAMDSMVLPLRNGMGELVGKLEGLEKVQGNYQITVPSAPPSQGESEAEKLLRQLPFLVERVEAAASKLQQESAQLASEVVRVRGENSQLSANVQQYASLNERFGVLQKKIDKKVGKLAEYKRKNALLQQQLEQLKSRKS